MTASQQMEEMEETTLEHSKNERPVRIDKWHDEASYIAIRRTY